MTPGIKRVPPRKPPLKGQIPGKHHAPKPPKRERISKSNIFWIQLIILAGVFGFISWWGYTQVMTMSLGRFSFFNLKYLMQQATEEKKIYLLYPIRTEEYLEPDSLALEYEWPYRPRKFRWKGADTLWMASYLKEPEADAAFTEIIETGPGKARMISLWEDLLYRLDKVFTIIYEPDLINLSKGNNTLIMPGALLLSEAEKKGVKDFVAHGGNLLVCWTPGCRDEHGRWTGFDFMTQLLGGIPRKAIIDSTGSASAVLGGFSPITAMIPPGTHLDFYTYNGNLALDIVEPRTISDGFWLRQYWSDLRPNTLVNNCVAAHGSYLDGKFVWFSFTPESVQESKDNNIIIEKLLTNAITWLEGGVVAHAEIWPEGYVAGGSLALRARGSGDKVGKILDGASNDGALLDIIIENKYESESILINNPIQGDIILMAQEGRNLVNSPYRFQIQWIKDQITWIKKITDKQPIGLYPESWSFGPSTLHAAAKGELKYVFGDPAPRYYGPTSQDIRSGGFWSLFASRVSIQKLPKAQLSLREWTSIGASGEQDILRRMKSDILRIRRANGIYLGIMDPETMIAEDILDLPGKLDAYMDSLGFWRAPISALIDRYSGWLGLRLTMDEKSTNRLSYQISNESKIGMKDVVFVLYFESDIFDDVSVTLSKVGVSPTNVRWNKETIKSGQRMQMSYVFGDIYNNRDYPRFLPANLQSGIKSSLVLFPQSAMTFEEAENLLKTVKADTVSKPTLDEGVDSLDAARSWFHF